MVDNVSSGTYTLTPVLAGRRFDPINRAVTVPPDAGGQGFSYCQSLYTYRW